MRRTLCLLCLLAATVGASAQTIVMNFTTGTLSTRTGTALGTGALLQVLASPDAEFSAPTPLAFTGGNDLLLASVASNDFGGDGVSIFTVEIDVTTAPYTTLTTSWSLALRWFPTLTTASTAPGYATDYGQFDASLDAAWKVPAAGANVDRNFLTVSGGGALADTLGRATLSTAAIPEPSTYAVIAGLAALGLAAKRRRSPLPSQSSQP